MLKICYIFLLILFTSPLHADTSDIVSQVYAEHTKGQTLQDCVDKATKLMQQMKIDEAKPLLDAGLTNFINHKNEHNYSLLLYMMADYLYYNQQYKEARMYYLEAEKGFIEYQDTLYLMMTYNSIGLTYSVEQDDNNTLKFYIKAIEAFPENTSNQNYKQIKLDTEVNIINQYFSTGNYNEIIQNTPRVIKLATELNDSARLASIYNALAIAHKNKGNFEESKNYFGKAILIYSSTGNDFEKSYIYNNLGSLFEYNDMADSAIFYYERALKLFQYEGYKIGIAKSKLGIASVLFNFYKKDDEARSYFYEAIEIARENDFTSVVLDGLYELSQLEYQQGNFKNAFDIRTQYHNLNDSLFNAENQQRYYELQTQFNTSQKENEINQLKNKMLEHELEKKKNQLQKEIGLSVIFLLAILVYIVYLFYIRKKNLNKTLEYKNDNISQQNERLKALVEKNIILTKKLQHSRHQLMASNATKSRFFSILAHDLRNPFHNILGQSFLLSSYYENFSADERKTFAREIHQSSDYLMQLLDNLLEWGRTQTGDINFDPAVLNLHDVTNQTLNILMKSAEIKNITIINAIDDKALVYADENMLKTILRNLIYNGIKFTHISGKIVIRNITQPDQTLIEIEDNGKGISNDALKHLFKPHSKYRTAGTENEKGTGLGLVICSELVKIHNGSIRVESNEGQGTTFTIELPHASYTE